MWHWIDLKKDTCVQCESQKEKVEHCLVPPQLGTSTSGDGLFLLLCECLWMTVKHREHWFGDYKQILASRWIKNVELADK